MKKRNICAVGIDLPFDENIEDISLESKKSLLDWDIILFNPDLRYSYYTDDEYMGKPCLSDSSSHKIKGQCEHWKREIKQALIAGKLVITFLCEFQEFYIDTGQRQYSGTGKNQKTTRIVDLYHNYKSIPIDLSPVISIGKAMKLTQGDNILKSYWNSFESISEYKVIITNTIILSPIITKSGDNKISGHFTDKSANGHIIFLPNIDFESSIFTYEDKDGEIQWTEKSEIITKNLISEFLSIYKALNSNDIVSVRPNWVDDKQYTLKDEDILISKIMVIEEKITKLYDHKNDIEEELKEKSKLKNLLYETGKPLEYSILEALKIIGFNAENYLDDDSEFDAVFSSKEGRLIGEAEGKDNKPINITKLRQLEMNILEDLEIQESNNPAKAVLFGNPQRLLPINERTSFFTEKCISAAQRSSTALVFTPDLYKVAQYLSTQKDTRFATKCRKAIINTIGRVTFPEILVNEINAQEKTIKEDQ